MRRARVVITTKGKAMTEAMTEAISGSRIVLFTEAAEAAEAEAEATAERARTAEWRAALLRMTEAREAREAAAETERNEREAAERAAMAARAATPQRFTYSAPGMSTRFTPTEADLIALGYSAESRVIEMFGATFYRDSTRYPEAMPRTIARWFKVSRETAAEMHDDTSGSTYTRAAEVDGTRYEAHYETANGMLTIFH
jgi:hypothetical protein